MYSFTKKKIDYAKKSHNHKWKEGYHCSGQRLVRRFHEVLAPLVIWPTCVLVADAPCYYVCLEETVYLDAVAEHHTMFWLSCNKKCQAVVVTVGISGTDEFSCDDCFLSLITAKNWFQTSNQNRDLVIYRVYLQMKSIKSINFFNGKKLVVFSIESHFNKLPLFAE